MIFFMRSRKMSICINSIRLLHSIIYDRRIASVDILIIFIDGLYMSI